MASVLSHITHLDTKYLMIKTLAELANLEHELQFRTLAGKYQLVF